MNPEFPATEIRFSPEDGDVYEVRVGSQVGWVSSHHLIEPKVNQLRTAWLRNYHHPAPTGPLSHLPKLK